MALLLYRGVLLAAFLLLSGGCASHEGTSSKPRDRSPAEEAGDQTMERKAPPFFIYRPGAGLTIESAEEDWSLRL